MLPVLEYRQEVPVKHVVVNKVVEESAREGYVERLSKGQAVGVEQLEQVRAALRRIYVKELSLIHI